jgi:polysaccharide export outer membrane protein
MRHITFTFLVLGLLFICSSCSQKQYQVLFEQKKSISDSSSQKNTAALYNYRIQPQDLIQVRNLQNSKAIVDMNPSSANASLQGNNSDQGEILQVEDDGTIPLTGLGRVQVAGLTRIEAQKTIEDLYRKILRDPIIELKINNLKVTVFGEAKGQGNFPLTKDRTTLVEMIGQAGGLTEKANETNIKIIRGTQKNPQVTEIDLSNIQSINDPRAVLQNGDIIYIAQNKRAVRNDKISNFSSIFQPALLLFNTALIIVTLIRH